MHQAIQTGDGGPPPLSAGPVGLFGYAGLGRLRVITFAAVLCHAALVIGVLAIDALTCPAPGAERLLALAARQQSLSAEVTRDAATIRPAGAEELAASVEPRRGAAALRDGQADLAGEAAGPGRWLSKTPGLTAALAAADGSLAAMLDAIARLAGPPAPPERERVLTIASLRDAQAEYRKAMDRLGTVVAEALAVELRLRRTVLAGFAAAMVALLACKWALVYRPILRGLEDQISRREYTTRSESRLADIARRTSNSIVVTDAQGRIEWVNQGFTRVTGYTLGECAGLTPGSLLQGPRSDPVEIDRMRQAIRAGERVRAELVNYTKGGDPYVVSLEIEPLLDEHGRVSGYMSIETDVTRQRQMEADLRAEANTDRLTGLANRRSMLAMLQRAVGAARGGRGRLFGLLYIDFDRFKIINDCLGHEMGDALLRQIADRFRETLSGSGVAAEAPAASVARMGGDEFVVLLDGLEAPEGASRVAGLLLTAFSKPFRLGEHEVFSTASIGVVAGRVGAESAESALRDADTAMYEAKVAGKGRHVVFGPEMRERMKRRLALESDLRKALPRGEFQLAYQPIVSLQSGEVNNFEALLRWSHPERGLISPAEFIPIAEDTGLIIAMGEWALCEACRQMERWRAEHGADAPQSVSVNLSRNQLMVPGLAATVRRILAETGVPAAALHLEVTESEMVRDAQQAMRVMTELRSIGVRLVMDDFGTGYSSLAFLHQFPLDSLKIDRSFVANLERGREMAALIHAVTELAGNLGITVIAEGIETQRQLKMLQALDCQYGQGHLFSMAMPGDDAPRFKSDFDSRSVVGREESREAA